jgi:hypothetical protein
MAEPRGIVTPQAAKARRHHGNGRQLRKARVKHEVKEVKEVEEIEEVKLSLQSGQPQRASLRLQPRALAERVFALGKGVGDNPPGENGWQRQRICFD